MDSLAIRVEPKTVEPLEARGGEASPTGEVRLEQGASSAFLLTPEEIQDDRHYPLITVLHGAGRQDELLARTFRDEAERRQALILIPRSVAPTWDLIALAERPDLDFLEYAFDLIQRRYPVDHFRKALLGFSDGASYALSVGLSNPGLFDGLMAWAAGFVALDPEAATRLPDAPKPRVYLEYGTHDELFGFEQVALPMRDNLRKAGCDVTFSVDEGGRHWPSGSFHREALDWYFGVEEDRG